MRKALVTGGAGFIGSHLCGRLLADGWEVIVLDDFSSGRVENIEPIRKRLTVIADDVRNICAHMDALADVQCVYHLAALISSHDSLHEAERYFETNVNGTLEVLRACHQLNRPRVVFASSSTVYGNPVGDPARPRTETDPTNPLTVYALSKLAAEHLLHIYSDLLGFDPVILRLFNVYGPRQSPDHAYANVTCKFSFAAATGGNVALYGDGLQSRDFVYVSDVVEAMLQVSSGSRERVYNVGTGATTTILNLLETIQHVSGKPLPAEHFPPWTNDIRSICADVRRIRNEFGLAPSVTLADGLRSTIESFCPER